VKIVPVRARLGKVALASLVTATLVLAPQLEETGAARARKRGRPNVLIFITDDQRVGEGSLEVMPNTRAIGNKGIFYRNGYVTNPLCCPSRASIMTGRYSHNHGVVDNDTPENLDQRTTIQYRLHKVGYDTSIFGKYMNAYSASPRFFDRWFVHRGLKYYRDPKFNDQGRRRRIQGYVTDILKKKSISYLESLERRDKKPWFMLVAPIAPHVPAIPAKRHKDSPIPEWDFNPAILEDDVSDKPPWVQLRDPPSLNRMSALRARQLRTLMSVDQMVGRLDKKLRNLDEKRDTLVIFISDNGFSLGEHRMDKGMVKKHPYESSVKVPFIVRWPAEMKSTTSRRLVSNVDIAPTVYDAARVQPPVEVDGRSLLDRTWQRQFLFLEHYENLGAIDDIPDWGSVLYRDHQYVEYRDDLGVPQYREYYDLISDPWQLENLLGDDDLLNDPNTVGDTLLVRQLWTCHGTSGDNPCP
jgi:arylsulfatase A-like enzyme